QRETHSCASRNEKVDPEQRDREREGERHHESHRIENAHGALGRRSHLPASLVVWPEISRPAATSHRPNTHSRRHRESRHTPGTAFCCSSPPSPARPSRDRDPREIGPCRCRSVGSPYVPHYVTPSYRLGGCVWLIGTEREGWRVPVDGRAGLSSIVVIAFRVRAPTSPRRDIRLRICSDFHEPLRPPRREPRRTRSPARWSKGSNYRSS